LSKLFDRLKKALQILQYRKGYFIGLTMMIALSVSLVMTIVPLFRSLIDSTWQKNAGQYGEQHAVIFDASQLQRDSVRIGGKLKRAGTIRLYGTYREAAGKTPITIGSFDREAFSLGHIRLKAGKMPKSHHEIALENNILSRLADGVGIGSTIVLENGEGASIKYTISGILNDYSSTWNMPEELRRGQNDLPSGVILPTDGPITEKAAHVLLYFNDYNPDYITIYLKNIGVDDYNGIINTNFYLDGYGDIWNLTLFFNLFYVIVLILFGITIWFGYRLFLYRTKNTYQAFYILGGQTGKLFLLFMNQVLLITLSGYAMGMCLGFIFANIGNFFAHLDSLHVYTGSNLLRSSAVSVIAVLIPMIVFSRVILPLHNKPLSQEKMIPLRPMERKGGFLQSFVRYHVRNNIGQLAPLLLAVCVLLTLTSFTQLYFQGMYINNSSDEDADYMLKPYKTEVYRSFGAFSLYQARNRSFDVENVHRLSNMAGIRFAQEEPSMEGAVMVFDDTPENQYWNQWSSHSDMEIDYGLPDAAPNGVIGISDYYVVVANDEIIEAIRRQYGDELHGRTINSDSVLLFLPTAGEEEHPSVSSLKFGRLSIGDEVDFYDVLHHMKDIEYSTYDLKVDLQISHPLDITVGSALIDSESPAIVVSEKEVAHSNLFTGINRLDLYVDPGLSTSQRNVIDTKVKDYVMSYPDSFFFSLADQIAKEAKYIAVIQTVSNLITIFLSLFVMVNFYNIMYFSLLDRRKTLGLYQALGMDNKVIFRSVFLELCIYSAVCIIAATILNLVLSLFTHDSSLLRDAILPLTILLVVFIAISYWTANRMIRFLQSGSIYSVLRREE